MGCDIHLWIEARRNGRWEFAHPFHVKEDDGEAWIEWTEPYNRRNYFLFAILANVRNRESLLRPISLPRGMPSDLSETGSRIIGEWAGDAHSSSWLAADELLSHDWGTRVRLKGYVTLEEELRFRRTGATPDDWCSSPNGRWIAELEWETTERDLCREFVDTFVQALKQHGQSEAVRVCFFFDN